MGAQFQVALKSDTNRKFAHKSSSLCLREMYVIRVCYSQFSILWKYNFVDGSFFSVTRSFVPFIFIVSVIFCAFVAYAYVAKRRRHKMNEKKKTPERSLSLLFFSHALLLVFMCWCWHCGTQTHTHKMNQIELWVCTIFWMSCSFTSWITFQRAQIRFHFIGFH